MPTSSEINAEALNRTCACGAEPAPAPNCVYTGGRMRGKRLRSGGIHLSRRFAAAYELGRRARQPEIDALQAQLPAPDPTPQPSPGPTPDPQPEPEPAPDPQPTPDPEPVPQTSTFRFGAAFGSNTEPVELEQAAGVPLGVSVTYWTITSQIDSAVRRARADLLTGRTPWLSFKFGMPWADVVAGKADALVERLRVALTAVLDELGLADAEVWVTLHHEPEGDEPNMPEFVAAQRRTLKPLAADDRILGFVSLTGWTNLYSHVDAYTVEALWPGDDVAEGLSFDPYNEYATVQHPTGEKYWTDLVGYLDYLHAWQLDHPGKRTALRETGLADAAMGHPGADRWITTLCGNADARGLAAVCYFDTTLNTGGNVVGTHLNAAKRADLLNAMRLYPGRRAA